MSVLKGKLLGFFESAMGGKTEHIKDLEARCGGLEKHNTDLAEALRGETKRNTDLAEALRGETKQNTDLAKKNSTLQDEASNLRGKVKRTSNLMKWGSTATSQLSTQLGDLKNWLDNDDQKDPTWAEIESDASKQQVPNEGAESDAIEYASTSSSAGPEEEVAPPPPAEDPYEESTDGSGAGSKEASDCDSSSDTDIDPDSLSDQEEEEEEAHVSEASPPMSSEEESVRKLYEHNPFGQIGWTEVIEKAFKSTSLERVRAGLLTESGVNPALRWITTTAIKNWIEENCPEYVSNDERAWRRTVESCLNHHKDVLWVKTKLCRPVNGASICWSWNGTLVYPKSSRSNKRPADELSHWERALKRNRA